MGGFGEAPRDVVLEEATEVRKELESQLVPEEEPSSASKAALCL